MKRRDLLKAGIILSPLILSGCGKKKKTYEGKIIKPKPPSPSNKYMFSMAMPFDFKYIDEIAALNEKYKKLKITYLYNNLPLPAYAYLEEYFQHIKGLGNPQIQSFDDFGKYVKYAQDKGFEFFYILNSPMALPEKVWYKQLDNLYDLLDKIHNLGCKNIKIANFQLLNIIKNYKYDFDISLSTCCEYRSLSQYKTLVEEFGDVKLINTAPDYNRDFVFLKNLRKLFPKTKIEILLNEGCVYDCPARSAHQQTHFMRWNCDAYAEEVGYLDYFCRKNNVYPFDLGYFSAIGINDFKLSSVVPRDCFNKLSYNINYLDCVENGIENLTVNNFFVDIFGYEELRINEDIKLTEILEYLPSMEHFSKYGNKCTAICGVECNYCHECAKALEKLKIFPC